MEVALIVACGACRNGDVDCLPRTILKNCFILIVQGFVAYHLYPQFEGCRLHQDFLHAGPGQTYDGGAAGRVAIDQQIRGVCSAWQWGARGWNEVHLNAAAAPW